MVTAGEPFTIIVAVEDLEGNVDTNFHRDDHRGLLNNPGGATLGGTLSIAAVNGVAQFTDLTLDKAGSGYTIRVSDDGLDPSVTTTSIEVTPAAATQLLVSSQPPVAVEPGQQFGIVVTATDAYGNTDTTFSGVVQLSLAPTTSGAVLGGTLSVTAQSGVVHVSDLTVDLVGTGYQIQATGEGLTTLSEPFEVRPVVATHLAVIAQPPEFVAVGSSFSLTIAAVDAAGNLDTTFNGPVRIAIGDGPLEATLGGTLNVQASSGQATFSDLTLDQVGAGFSLYAWTESLGAVSTNLVSVDLPAQWVQVIVQPPETVISGSTFGLTVAFVDANGQTVRSYNEPVTVTLQNGYNSTLTGTTQVTGPAGRGHLLGPVDRLGLVGRRQHHRHERILLGLDAIDRDSTPTPAPSHDRDHWSTANGPDRPAFLTGGRGLAGRQHSWPKLHQFDAVRAAGCEHQCPRIVRCTDLWWFRCDLHTLCGTPASDSPFGQPLTMPTEGFLRPPRHSMC